MAVYFPASSEFSLCTCVLFTFRPLGTLCLLYTSMGDIVLAGTSYGKVKAMFNERNQRIKEAGPSEPVLILGLDVYKRQPLMNSTYILYYEVAR